MELVVAKLLMVMNEGTGGLGEEAKDEARDAEEGGELGAVDTNEGSSNTGDNITINHIHNQNENETRSWTGDDPIYQIRLKFQFLKTPK